MHRIHRAGLVAVVVSFSMSACTWVKPESGALTVRVLDIGANVASCTKLGEIGVSVKDKVGLYRRGELKVRDELETLARNEAVGLKADAVQPLGEPVSGEQRFAALRCGTTVPQNTAPPAATRQAPPATPLQIEEAETYPVK